MLRSPITRNGKIRYFELIKLSILIGFLYAYISSLLQLNLVVIMLSGSFLSLVACVLASVNLVLLTQNFFDELKAYVDQKLHIIFDEIKLPHFKQIQKHFQIVKENAFVKDIQLNNMVSLC